MPAPLPRHRRSRGPAPPPIASPPRPSARAPSQRGVVARLVACEGGGRQRGRRRGCICVFPRCTCARERGEGDQFVRGGRRRRCSPATARASEGARANLRQRRRAELEGPCATSSNHSHRDDGEDASAGRRPMVLLMGTARGRPVLAGFGAALPLRLRRNHKWRARSGTHRQLHARNHSVLNSAVDRPPKRFASVLHTDPA